MLTASTNSENSSSNVVEKDSAQREILKVCSTQELESNPFFKLVNESGLKKMVENKVERYVCDDEENLYKSLNSGVHGMLDGGEHFLSSLQDALGDEQSLNLLVGNIYISQADENSSAALVDSGFSLLRTLIKVELIQPRVINVILESMTVHATESEGDEGTGVENEKNVTKALLSQLKWIENLCDGRSLTNKLVECLQVCPLEAQRDIISMIPEIIDDAEQESVVETLVETMEGEIRLTVTVLDSISNLFLSDEKKQEATERVLNMLSSSSLSDLPVILRFLIDGCTADNSASVIRVVRQHLSELINAGNNNFSDQDADRSSSEALILESLRASLRYRRDVIQAWMKIVEQTENSSDNSICTFDLWVLGSLYSMKKESSAADKLIKKKASAGAFNEPFVLDVFCGHATALAPLFSNFLEIAAQLFYGRGASKAAENKRAAGRSLYIALFSEYGDDFHRQEIVGNLITHIGSGVNHEVDAALKTLEDLLESENTLLRKGLRNFIAFVRGLLDYVEFLNTAQQRSVFYVLTSLSLPTARGQSSGIDEITIIVRKMLASSVAHVKRVGIIGGTAILCVVSSAERKYTAGLSTTSHGSQLSQENSLPRKSPFERLSLDMLRMLEENCSSAGNFNARGLFYEELAFAISKRRYGSTGLSQSMMSRMMDTFSSSLEKTCFLDAPSPAEDGSDQVHFLGGAMTQSFRMNLDAGSAQVAVNILPLLISSRKNVNTGVWCLCSLFRLIAVLEMETTGTLSGVDACLGCPLALFDESTDLMELTAKSRSVQNVACDALFVAINWVREMLNSFIGEKSSEMRAKVFIRVVHLLELESNLRVAIEANPMYRPPALATTGTFSKVPAPKKKRKKASAAKGRAKKRGAKPARTKKRRKKVAKKARSGGVDNDDDELTDDLSSDEESEDASQKPISLISQRPSSKASGSSILPGEAKTVSSSEIAQDTYNRVYKMLRPLEPEVSYALSLSQLERKITDTNQETLASEELKLTPQILNFLLDHTLTWLKQSLPKGSGNSPLALARKAKETDSNTRKMRPEELMSLVTGKIDCYSTTLERKVDVFSVVQTVGLAFQDIKECLKSETMPAASDVSVLCVTSAEEKPMMLVAAHKTFEAIKTICLCDRLTQTAEGVQLLTKTFHMFDEIDDEEDREDLPIWAGLSAACRGVFNALTDIYSALPNIESDVLPLLQAAEAVAKLQQFADKQSIKVKEPVLQEDSEVEPVSHRLSRLCRLILEQNWAEHMAGATGKFKYKMGTLGWTLRLHLRLAAEPLDAAEYICTDVLPQFLDLTTAKEFVENFPTLNRQSLPIFFVTLLESLVAIMRSIDFKHGKSKVVLFNCRKVALYLKNIVLLTKHNALVTVTMMTNVLKHMRSFVDIVNKNMDFFENFFASREEEVCQFFKVLQSSTRQVHNICAYGKNEKKNSAVAALIPGIKKSLEEFIYRVKGMLLANGREDLFWLGNLRTRNLDGTEWRADSSEEDDED